MKTDDLLRALAADGTVAPTVGRRLPGLLLAAALVSFAGLWATIGLRPDVGRSITTFLPAMRYVLTLALFGLALMAALQLSRPEARVSLWPLLVPPVATVALVVFTLIVTPAEGWGMAWIGKTIWQCLLIIPLLSVLPVAALLAAMRQGAAMRPRLSSALAGLSGGGLGAAIYALHCTENSPLFYASWYSLAILGVTLVTTLVGPRVLRW